MIPWMIMILIPHSAVNRGAQRTARNITTFQMILERKTIHYKLPSLNFKVLETLEFIESSNSFLKLNKMKNQPKITVGIMDRQTEVTGRLDGNFHGDGFGPVSGRFSAKAEAGMIVLTDEAHREICRSPSIRLTADSPGRPFDQDSGQPFTLFHVTIGNRFHWERTEDQTFQGDLILRLREDGTIAAINEIPLEDYLTSVISSEMNAAAPMEFLKAHAILSRSWLLAALGSKEENRRNVHTTDGRSPKTKER